MTEETTNQITEYVYKNYRWLKDKPLIIREKSSCYHIVSHQDSSPLILGKKTFEK